MGTIRFLLALSVLLEHIGPTSPLHLLGAHTAVQSFYIISGFRYGFLETADSPILVGAFGLLALNVALWAICYTLLRRGWKIKQ